MGSLHWLLTDHLGSTMKSVKASDGATSERRYRAWGEARFVNGTTPTNYRYTGQYEQPEIGLYYYGARWYDTALGRFTSPDSIVPEASQGVQAWDRYAYVNNSPINLKDPKGHWACADYYDPACAESIQEIGEFQKATFATEPFIMDKGIFIIVVMAPNNTQVASRSELFQRFGLSGAFSSIIVDAVETVMAVVPDIGVGEEDLAALFDVGLTLVSSLSSGLSWTPFDHPVDELPRMFTISQDVIVPIADLLIASGAKISAGLIGGPPAVETFGSGVDAVTSIANGIYDAGRYFEVFDPHYSIGLLPLNNPLNIYLIYYP